MSEVTIPYTVYKGGSGRPVWTHDLKGLTVEQVNDLMIDCATANAATVGVPVVAVLMAAIETAPPDQRHIAADPGMN